MAIRRSKQWETIIVLAVLLVYLPYGDGATTPATTKGVTASVTSTGRVISSDTTPSQDTTVSGVHVTSAGTSGLNKDTTVNGNTVTSSAAGSTATTNKATVNPGTDTSSVVSGVSTSRGPETSHIALTSSVTRSPGGGSGEVTTPSFRRISNESCENWMQETVNVTVNTLKAILSPSSRERLLACRNLELLFESHNVECDDEKRLGSFIKLFRALAEPVCSLEEYPGCYPDTAGRCFHDYFSTALHGNTAKMCRQVTVSQKCMSSAVSYCPSLHRNAISMIINQMMLTSKSMCGSMRCNVEGAMMCMRGAQEMMNMKDDDNMFSTIKCGQIKASLSCMFNHTSMCDKDYKSAMLPTIVENLKNMHEKMEKTCTKTSSIEKQKITMMQGYEGIMSIAILISNPFLSRRDLCSIVRSTKTNTHHLPKHIQEYMRVEKDRDTHTGKEENSRNDEDNSKSDEEGMRENVYGIMKTDDMIEDFMMKYDEKKDDMKKDNAKGDYQNDMDKDETKKKDDKEKGSFQNMMRDMIDAKFPFQLIGDYCSEPEDEESLDNVTVCTTEDSKSITEAPPLCKPEKALACITDANIPQQFAKHFDLFDMSKTVDNVCPSVHKVVLCVKQNVLGCEVAQKEVVEKTMKAALSLVQDKCPMPTEPPVEKKMCKPAPRVCRVQQAYKECISDVVLKENTLCPTLNSTFHCIKQLTTGCSSLQMIPLTFAQEELMSRSKLASSCVIGINTTKSDDFSKISECYSMAAKSFHYIFMQKNHKNFLMCHTFEEFEKCTDSLKLGLLTRFFIKKTTSQFKDFSEAYCKVEKEQSVVCEHSTLDLHCPPGHVLDILTASYGRRAPRSKDLCNNQDRYDQNCSADTSLPAVKSKCHGKGSCSVLAGNTVFGDPCVSTVKYLEVEYTCKGDKELLSECKLAPESGMCKAYIEKYYYNETDEACQKFVWGGCGGNDNRFDTKAECEKTCMRESTVTNGTSVVSTDSSDHSNSCNMKEISRCIVGYMTKLASLQFSPFIDHSSVCSEMRSTKTCVTTHLEACTDEFQGYKDYVKGAMDHLYAVHKRMCPMKKISIPKERMCDKDVALSCLEYFSHIVSTSQGDDEEQLCRELNHTLSCVHSTTYKCAGLDLSAVDTSLDLVKDIIGSKCPRLSPYFACQDVESRVVSPLMDVECNSTSVKSVCTLTWTSCFSGGMNAASVCGKAAFATCITDHIANCGNDMLNIAAHQLSYLSTTLAPENGGSCEILVDFPSTFTKVDINILSCLSNLSIEVNNRYLGNADADENTVCAVFRDYSSCAGDMTDSPAVLRSVVEGWKKSVQSTISKLCTEARTVNPCSTGSPMKDQFGHTLFCGRGVNRTDCPSGSACNIAVDDSYAVCCPDADDSENMNETTTMMMTTQKPKDCGKAPADIMFLVDESSSIGATNFQDQLNFVQTMVSQLMGSQSDTVQIGLVTFSREPENRFFLNRFKTAKEMNDLIGGIQYGKSGTDIAKGLKYVRENSFTKANGARDDASKILILMTDGRSSDTSTEARLMKATGATVLVIAIGRGINRLQLEEIASKQELVFEVTDFKALNSIVESFFAAIPCPEEPTTCKLESASTCMSQYTSALMAGLLPLTDREQFCRESDTYKECVVNHTLSCSDEKKMKYMSVLRFSESLIQDQSVCIVPEKPKVCKPQRAMMCISQIASNITAYYKTHVKTAICSGLQSAEDCVSSSIKDCDQYQRMAIETTFHDMMLVAKQACAGPRLPKPTYDTCGEELMGRCDVMEGLNCLVKVHAHVMSPYPKWKEVCSALPTLRHCVRRQVAGCVWYEQETMKKLLNRLLSRTGDKCPERECDTCTALHCIAKLGDMKKESHTLDKKCSERDLVKKCVAKSTRHCPKKDVMHVNMKLDIVLKEVNKECDGRLGECVEAFEATAWSILKYGEKKRDSSSGSKSNENKGSNQESNESHKDSKESSKNSSGDVKNSRKKRSAEKSTDKSDENEKSDKKSVSSENKDKSKSNSAEKKDARMSTEKNSKSMESSKENEEEEDCIEDEEESEEKDQSMASDKGSKEKSKEKDSKNKSKDKDSKEKDSKSKEIDSKDKKSGGKSRRRRKRDVKEKISGSKESKKKESDSKEKKSGSKEKGSKKESNSKESNSEKKGSSSKETKKSTEKNSTEKKSSEAKPMKKCKTKLQKMCEKVAAEWKCVVSHLKTVGEDASYLIETTLRGIWTAVQNKCKAPKLQCYTCHKSKSNLECNAYKPKICSSKMQTCGTVVDKQHGTVTKGCMNPASCKTMCTPNNKRCSYCCSGPLCNQPMEGVIEDPESCKGHSAVKCGFTLVHSVLMKRDQICNSMEASLKCIKQHTVKCITDSYRPILTYAMMIEKSVTMARCETKQLQCACGLCGSLSLGILIQNKLVSDADVCRHLKYTIHGTHLAAKENKCSPEEFSASYRSLLLAKSVIRDTCDMVDIKVVRTTAMPMTTTMRRTTVANNGSAEVVDDDQMTCNIDAARQCIATSRTLQSMVVSAFTHGWTEVCRAAFSLKMCVTRNLVNCSDSDALKEMHKKLEIELKEVKMHCDLESEDANNTRIIDLQEDVCEISQAHACLAALSNSTIDACIRINQAKECLVNYTSSCLTVQRTPITYIYSRILDLSMDQCNGTLSIFSPRLDYHVELSTCLHRFGMKFHHALITRGSNSSILACHATSYLTKCLMSEKLSPLGKIYMKRIDTYATMLNMHFCDEYEEDLASKPLFCYRCEGSSSEECIKEGRMSMCSKQTQMCVSKSMQLNGTLSVTKGCVPVEKCKNMTCDSATGNCSYCCNDNYCNKKDSLDVTMTTVAPPISTEQPACGYSVSDIVFLVDESSSIGANNFQIVKSFLVNVIKGLNVGEDTIRVGLVTFSGAPQSRFQMNTYYNSTDMISAINAIPYNRRGTDIAAGMDYVRENTLLEANGNRPDVKDIVVLMTDGRSGSTTEATRKIKEAGVTMLVIGVTSAVDRDQINSIASDPSYVFTVDSFSVLDTIKQKFLESIPCPEEPESCKLEMATTCVNSFLLQVLTNPFALLSERKHFCSAFSEVEKCSAMYLKNCPHAKVLQFETLMAWLETKKTNLCIEPPKHEKLTCDGERIKMCLHSMLPYLTAGSGNVQKLCRAVNESLECVIEVKEQCPDEINSKFYQAVDIVKGIVGEECDDGTSSALCQLQWDGQHLPACNLAKANDCIATFENYSKNSFTYSKEEFCRLTSEAVDCITVNTKTCADQLSGYTSRISTALQNTTFTTCSLEAPSRPSSCIKDLTCNLTEIHSKVWTFHERTREVLRSGTGNVCQFASSLTTMVENQIKGCSSMQFTIAERTYYDYLNLYGCTGSLSVTYRPDYLENVTRCARGYFERSQNYINFNGNGGRRVCGASSFTRKCFGAEVRKDSYVMTNQIMTTWNVLDEYITGCYDNGTKIGNETDDCLVETARFCINRFLVPAAFIGFLRQSDRQSVCRGNSTALNACLTEATQNCTTERRAKFYEMRNLALRILHNSSFCQVKVSEEDESAIVIPTCFPVKAAKCMADLGVNISYYDTTRRSQMHICRQANITTKCVTRFLHNCSDEHQTHMTSTLKDIHHYALQMCQMKKTTVTRMVPPKCIDPMKVGPKATCNQAQALKCIKQLDMEIFNPFGYKERLCIIYGQTYQCVYDNTYNCASSFIAPYIHSIFDNVRSSIKPDYCDFELKTPCVVPSLCEMTQVQTCITNLRNRIAGTYEEGQKDICRMVSISKQCIMTHSNKCNKEEMQRINTDFKAVLELVDKDCDKETEAGDVYTCIDIFKSKVSLIQDYVAKGKRVDEPCDDKDQKKEHSSDKSKEKKSTEKSKEKESGSGKKESKESNKDSPEKDGSKAKDSKESKSAKKSKEDKSNESRRRRKRDAKKSQEKSKSEEQNSKNSKDKNSKEKDSKKKGSQENSKGKGSKQTSNERNSKETKSKEKDSKEQNVSTKKTSTEKTTKSGEMSLSLNSICVQMEEAWKCARIKIGELDAEKRAVVNLTLTGLYKTAKYLCKPHKCHRCKGLDDNSDCNNQAYETCDKDEVCFATKVDGQLTKGCGDRSKCMKGSSSGQGSGYCCTGYLCNAPDTGITPEKCNTTRSITCSLNILSNIMSSKGGISVSQLETEFKCIEESTSDCKATEIREVAVIVNKTKNAVKVGSCAGVGAKYAACGMTGVLSLARVAANPYASSAAVCSLKNTTSNMLSWAKQEGVCFDDEISAVQSSLNLVQHMIGDSCRDKKSLIETKKECNPLGTTNCTSNIEESICSNLNMTDNCLANYLEGCTSLDIAAVQPAVKMFIDKIEVKCQNSTDMIEMLRENIEDKRDDYTYLSRCISAMSDDVYHLMGEDDWISKSCASMSKFKRCLSTDLKISPLGSIYVSEMINMLSKKYDMMCGKDAAKTSGRLICLQCNEENLVQCMNKTKLVQCEESEVCSKTKKDVNGKEMLSLGCKRAKDCKGSDLCCAGSLCNGGDDVDMKLFNATTDNRDNISLENSTEKAGSCPEVPPGTLTIGIAECTKDSDCDGKKKCCGDFGKMCKEPIMDKEKCSSPLIASAVKFLTTRVHTIMFMSKSEVARFCSHVGPVLHSVLQEVLMCSQTHQDNGAKVLLSIQEEAMSVCHNDMMKVVTKIDVQKCQAKQALECFTGIENYLLQASTPEYVLCKKVLYVMKCVESYRVGCTANEFAAVNASLSLVHGMVSHQCLDVRTKYTCSVSNAHQCLKLLKPQDSGCSNYKDVETCVMRNIIDCFDLHSFMVKYSLFELSHQQLPKCSSLLTQPAGLQGTLFTLMNDFKTDIEDSLLEPKVNDFRKICLLYQTLVDKVRNTTKDTDIELLESMFKDIMPAFDSVINVCKVQAIKLKKSGSCPIVGEDVMGTADVECVRDTDCNGTRKCCSNGFGLTCMEANDTSPTLLNSAEVDPTCDLGVASSCLKSYLTMTMFSPLAPQMMKSSICASEGVAGAYLTCIRNATSSCSSYNLQFVDLATNLIESGLRSSGVCEKEYKICAPGDALDCIASLGDQLALTTLINNSDYTSVCSSYERTRICMKQSLYQCSNTQTTSVLKTYEQVRCLIGDMCVVQDEPEDKGTPLACIDPRAVDNSDRCDMNAAQECLRDVYSKVSSPYSTHSTICLSYSRSLKCYFHELGGCSRLTSSLAETALIRLSSVLQQYRCPTVVKTPCKEVDECKANEAMACVKRLEDMIIGSYEDEELCYTQEQAWRCVREKTEKCSQGKRLEVYQFMQQVQSKADISCEEDLDTCIYQFKTYSLKVLLSSVTSDSKEKSVEKTTKKPSGEDSEKKPSKENSGSKESTKEKSSKKKSAEKTTKEKSAEKTTKEKSKEKTTKEKSKEKTTKEKSAEKTTKEKSKEKTTKEKSAEKTTKEKSKEKTTKEKSKEKTTKEVSKATSVEKSSGSSLEQVTADVMAEYCDKVQVAWRCIESRLKSSTLPDGVVTVLMSTLTEVLYTVQQKCQGQKCYSCNDASSNDNCNNGYEYCPSNKQGCQTVFEDGRYEKGCVNPKSCVSGSSKGGKKIRYCCTGYLCNEPGTSVIEDPETCQETEISIYILNVVLMNVASEKNGVSWFCSNFQSTYVAVENKIQTCSDRTKNRMTSVLRSLTTVQETICSVVVTCNTSMALTCIQELSTSILLGTRFCNLYEEKLSCVAIEASKCSKSEGNDLKNQLKTVFTQKGINCHKLPGFKLPSTKNVIRVEEGGGPVFIDVALTASPKSVCTGNNCYINIDIKLEHHGNKKPVKCRNGNIIDQLLIGQTSASGFCTFSLTDSNWNTGQKIPLTAKLDGIFDGQRNMKITLVAKKYEDGTLVLQRSVATFYAVVVNNDRRVKCSSVNDPHMLTFDRLYYNNFHQGEFVLYRHTTLPYEVRAVYKKCGRASCNCAAMIKSGNDLITIDRCRSKAIKTAIFQNGALTPGTKIYYFKGQKKYKIILPIGTSITVKARSGLLNIWVFPSSADYKKTTGLCGLYDRDLTNDLMKPDGKMVKVDSKFLVPGIPPKIKGRRKVLYPAEFSKSWRVTENLWYIDRLPVSADDAEVNYCSCPVNPSNPSDQCSSKPLVETCGLVRRGKEITNRLKVIDIATRSNPLSRRRRRRAVDDDPLLAAGIAVNEEPVEPSWPTPNGWTLESAEDFCNKSILNSNVAQLCQKVTNSNYEKEIDDCVQDILLTDNTTFVEASIDSLKSDCDDVVERDPVYTTNETAANIANTIEENMCENDCSGNGQCVDGECKCFNGFISDDCSLSLSDPPIVESIAEDGLCDISVKSTCDTIEVNGEKFADIETLTCHLEFIEIGESSWRRTGTQQAVGATYITTDSIQCVIPASALSSSTIHAVLVSVSNNGKDKSADSKVFIGHNPNCYVCDVDSSTCQIVATGCVIQNACYKSGDVSADNACHFCDPLTNKTAWTRKFASYCPTEQPPTTTVSDSGPAVRRVAGSTTDNAPVIITGTIAGILFIAVLAIVIGLVLFKRSTLMKKKRDSLYSSSKSDNSIEVPYKDHVGPQVGFNNEAYVYSPADYPAYPEPGHYFVEAIPTRRSNSSRENGAIDVYFKESE